MSNFQYPVSTAREALSVTAPMFDADIFKNKLFVDLDEVRGGDFIEQITYRLGMEPDGFMPTNDYIKILFSGHIGCGKTVELMRLHRDLDMPTKYLSIFISVEDELVYSRFEPEDFYVLLITKLVQELKKRGITKDTASLERLANLILSSEEVEEIDKESLKDEVSAEAGIGVSFLNFLKLGLNLKTTLANESESSKKIRREVRSNLLHIIQVFNTYLTEIREEIKKQNQGQDILFIIDGFEKIQLDKYQKVLIQDANALTDLQCNLILSIPINSFYHITDTPMYFSEKYVVPMIKVDKPESAEKLKEIVGRRINIDALFENDSSIEKCIEFSGGCIRQLFEIINAAVLKTVGRSKINTAIVDNVIEMLGGRMRERLDSKHVEILKNGNFQPADEPVRWMLYGLILLKYNGIKSIRLNPLLEKYMKDAGELGAK